MRLVPFLFTKVWTSELFIHNYDSHLSSLDKSSQVFGHMLVYIYISFIQWVESEPFTHSYESFCLIY